MLCLLIASVDAPEEKRKIEQLYEKYNRLVYSIAYKSLRNSYDAEDAVFSSWEKVIKNIDKIGEVDAPETKGFLVVVVKHTIIDMCRKKKKMGEDCCGSSCFDWTYEWWCLCGNKIRCISACWS